MIVKELINFFLFCYLIIFVKLQILSFFKTLLLINLYHPKFILWNFCDAFFYFFLLRTATLLDVDLKARGSRTPEFFSRLVFLLCLIYTFAPPPFDYPFFGFHLRVLIWMILVHLTLNYYLICEIQTNFLFYYKFLGINYFLFCFRLLLMLISFG